MSEFKEITTQEQLDAIISERLKRQAEKVTSEVKAQYADYDDLKKKVATLQTSLDAHSNDAKELEELKTKVAKYETDSVKTRAALENGLPVEFASRISGTTTDEINEDAKKLASFFSTKKSYPMFTKETDLGKETEASRVNAAYEQIAKKI